MAYPPQQGGNMYPAPQPGQSPPGPSPPQQGQYPPPQQGQYPPPQQGQYPPPQQGQYPPPQQGQYPPPQQGQYPPPQQGQYPPPQQGQSPPQGQYPPPQGQPGQYPPAQPQGQYPPPQGQYPPAQPPPQGQYPPAQQGQYPPPGQQQDGSAPWQPGQGGAHQWDNLPSKPLDDNPNAQPEPEMPPTMDGMYSFKGYEGCGGFGQAVPTAPPPPPPPPAKASAPPMEIDSVGNMKSDECREAMLEYVGQHCCYGKGTAEDMDIKQIIPTTAMHYTMESFCERRNTGYAFEPYRGGMVDGPQCGYPPGPWDIPCAPDSHFMDVDKALEVPHTSTIQPCHRCNCRGFTRCHRCHGMGRNRCITCHGDGRVTRSTPEGTETRSCTMCGGDGRRRCMTCHGDGRITCTQCRGFRQLRCFIRLTVSFKNHKSDYVLEKTDMPDELVKGVQGTVVFEQTLPQVWPIVAYHVQEINENSQRLVDQHCRGFTDARRLNQRQILRAVPVTEVHYEWKDVKTRFWVYGRERKVHAPDYPQTCCWGCNIL